jgi:hypothetical protein
MFRITQPANYAKDTSKFMHSVLLTHGLEFKKDAQLAGNCLILIAPCWG